LSDLQVAVEDGALRVRFARPEVHNALSAEMVEELTALLEGLPRRDDVRVVLLTGSGRSFSSGADLSGPDAHRHLDVRAVDQANRLVRAIVHADQPVVAAVDGVAAGFGCSLALACDLVVASARSTFLLAFARVGLMPDGGATATVTAAVGRARAMRMGLLGEALSAAEAYAAGLVSHLVEDADHPREVDAILRRLAGGAPLAQAATKRAVNAAALERLEPALEAERRGQSLLLRTEDAAEGMRAFAEKRPAEFRGR